MFMMSLYAETSRLRTCSADWKPIWAFCIATMVSSRPTRDGSAWNVSARRPASCWLALTERSAWFSAPLKDTVSVAGAAACAGWAAALRRRASSSGVGRPEVVAQDPRVRQVYLGEEAAHG